MSEKPHYDVVAAIIVHNKEFLCMQRGQTRFPYTSFKYEFPGGKIEPRETPEEALHREIREEMDYEITIHHPFMTVTHEYPDFSITMEAFLCTASNRLFTRREHHNHQWLPADKLSEIEWAAADAPIAQELATKNIFF